MKLSVWSVVVSAFSFATAQGPPECIQTVEIDFSTFPDGPLDPESLEETFGIFLGCQSAPGLACVIDNGKIKGVDNEVPGNPPFEIVLAFSDLLYTGGIEVVTEFLQPISNTVNPDGSSFFPLFTTAKAGGPRVETDLNIPPSFPGVTTTVDYEADINQVQIFLTVETNLLSFKLLCDGGGGGGDPHFTRWRQPHRDTFHGECDIVLLHSRQFHLSSGLDVHVRTTIDSYFSFIESAAVRIGDHILEVSSPDTVYLDGEEKSTNESLEFANQNYTYKYSLKERRGKKSIFRLDLGTAVLYFKFYAHFLTISINGRDDVLGDSVGLMGRHKDGSMWGRDGKPFAATFENYGFEWQVNAGLGDPILFRDSDRSPQLPYERCRLPTAAIPQRRRLRSINHGLYEKAKETCDAVATKRDVDLCIDDVMTTGELGLTEVW